jgi:uncharacterized membrane protein YvlD (DUF360 family)
MTITWRGLGFLGFIIPGLFYVVATMITPLSLGAPHYRTAFILFLISTVVVWFLGKFLNGDAEGDEAPHLCMGMRLQTSALISLGAAILTRL